MGGLYDHFMNKRCFTLMMKNTVNELQELKG